MDELWCDAWQAAEAVTDVLEHIHAGAPRLCPLLGYYRSAACHVDGCNGKKLLSLPGLTECH
jgi:hypothetical protein